MIVRVRCTFEIDVELPESARDNLEFIIEDNGCPGTGSVGAAVEAMIAQHESQSTCWACACRGENEIISIDGVTHPDKAKRHRSVSEAIETLNAGTDAEKRAIIADLNRALGTKMLVPQKDSESA